MKKNQPKWGNTKNHQIFCEQPGLHNDGETEVWEVECKICAVKLNACSECVMEGDVCCPKCGGAVDMTKAQTGKTEKAMIKGVFENKFGKPGLN